MGTLVVVPARKGSKGVPRKNVRLMDGIPLIEHVLRTAVRLRGATVVVTTDDPEVREIGRRMNCMVVDRPLELAGDTVPLDPVIHHAWLSASEGDQSRWTSILTLQPTSPLTGLATLQRASEMLEGGQWDSVVSVTDARHLHLTIENGQPVPMFPRVNRQELPEFYRETGGVIGTTPATFAAGKRLGGRVGLLAVLATEAIDIDSIHDWGVAEYWLRAPHIAMRVKGNESTGLGHAFRVIALARRVIARTMCVAVDSDSQLAADLLTREGVQVTRVAGDQEFIDLCEREEVDFVINDILDTTETYVHKLQSNGRRMVVNFEDWGAGSMAANLTINALYEHVSPLPHIVGGWRYADLREEFELTTPRQTPAGSVMLVTFGGTDPSQLTERSLAACAEASRSLEGWTVRVVVGPGNPRGGAIEALCASMSGASFKCEFLRNVTRMSEVMRDATFALTSNGRTVYELAGMRVPMVTISQNVRETAHTFGRASGGAMDLGPAALVRSEELSRAIAQMAGDSAALDAMRRRLAAYDLRGGTDRIVERMMREYAQWRITARERR